MDRLKKLDSIPDVIWLIELGRQARLLRNEERYFDLLRRLYPEYLIVGSTIGPQVSLNLKHRIAVNAARFKVEIFGQSIVLTAKPSTERLAEANGCSISDALLWEIKHEL